MTTKKDKFKQLVSNETTTTVGKNRNRIKNRAKLREAQQIALKVLTKLDELGWSQRTLATKMGVSPQQITKIVKGTENFTLETQIRLQEILDIPILATYQKQVIKKVVDEITFSSTHHYNLPKHNIVQKQQVLFSQVEVKTDYNKETSKYSYYSQAV